MRCKNCNVDLPENYTVCPLCNGKTNDEPPHIDGVITAEYPKVKTQPYKRNPFPIFLGVWFVATLIFVILSKLGIVSEIVSAVVFCAIPCIWTVFLRPFMVDQLYIGNYIIMNLYPFALTCATFSYITESSLKSSFHSFIKDYLPLCFIAVLVALIIVIFLDSKNKKRAAAYPVLVLAPSVIITIVLSVTEKALLIPWIVTIALCMLILVFLFATKPQETKDELAAKFSIQKSVKSYK